MKDIEQAIEDYLNRWADQSVTPTFDDSGEAYNRCNSDAHMHTGRIFTVPSEKIVGIAWAWPIAVTAVCGKLHSASTDPRTWTGSDAEPEIAAAVEKALELARSNGWTLAPWGP